MLFFEGWQLINLLFQFILEFLKIERKADFSKVLSEDFLVLIILIEVEFDIVLKCWVEIYFIRL